MRCVSYILATTPSCNQFISDTFFDSDAGLYYASFNGSDLEFLDPSDDKNVDQNILDELGIAIAITDPKYTANTDAYMYAMFLDQGMLH